MYLTSLWNPNGNIAMEEPLLNTKECPCCAETIKAQAIMCRFCNCELNIQKLAEDDIIAKWASYFLVISSWFTICVVFCITKELAVLVVPLALGLYFLPTGLASGERQDRSVFLINLFLGWTLIGWLIALAMAVVPSQQEQRTA